MIRVLLVDDHPLVRTGLRHLFAQQPDLRIVGEASDTQALLELLVDTPADVLVLDRRMPGLDVLATLPLLRAQYPGLRILVFSLETSLAAVAALFAAGATGYLNKAAPPEELLVALRLVALGRPFLGSTQGLQALLHLSPTSVAIAKPVKQPFISLRERQVLALLVQGWTNAEMAEQLFTSKRTVETHRQHLLEKTDTRNTAALVRYALEQGLVT